MKKLISATLGLQDFVVYGVAILNSQTVARVGRPRRPNCCPRCHSKRISKHSSGKPRRILHTRAAGKIVYLEVKARRYRCCGCGRTFTEALPGIARYQRRTEHASAEILQQARDMSMTAAGKLFGLGYHAVRSCLERLDLGSALRDLAQIPGELRLGIDEHSFRGRDMVVSVTLLHPVRRLICILENDRQRTLMQFLQSLPAGVSARISEVCIDMSRSFSRAVSKTLPHARIVVDKFHLVHDANRRLDQARIIETQNKRAIPKLPLLKANERLSPLQAQTLKYILAKYPRLHGFYWMKEQIRQLYLCESIQTANLFLGRIILNAENGDDPELRIWAQTLKRWRPQILNYMISRTTNAYTEGVHTKVKWLKRTGFGFRNLGVYVRRIILAFLPAVSLIPQHTY